MLQLILLFTVYGLESRKREKNFGLFHLSFSRFHGVELGEELLLEGVAQRVIVPHKPMDESGKDPVDTNFSRSIKIFALNTEFCIRIRMDPD